MRLSVPMPLPVLALVVACLGVPQGAAAQEVRATLHGHVDGTAMVWHVVEIGGESGSYWADMGTLHQVTVFAFADNGGTSGLRPDGALEFSLTLDSRESPMRVVGAQVTFFPEDSTQAFAVPRRAEGRVDVALEDTRIDGRRMHLRGQLATPLQRLTDPLSQRFDPEDTIDIDVSFDLSVGSL
ncbi:hypothetical protein [Rhodobaculum claviforme]|uniref:YceI-like domain-containing protein n=1 Tax=Rhodobaculum claviforme TaxID=1549854 RepID=A0A934TMB6_9RHOB|nr:hypothetical protein [Rhodobaculum claviforme]MBK5928146.1 hypothetical protein [Rhodobaculum claviforme]